MSVEISDEPGRRADPPARGAGWQAIARGRPRLVAVAWTVLLLSACLAPKQLVPDERAFTARRHLPPLDLAVHLALFAGFTASWLRVGRSPRRWLAIAAAGLFLAVATELAQGLPIINRDPNLLDAAADIAGVLVGLIGMASLLRLRGRSAR
jgi:hypothetical protein